MTTSTSDVGSTTYDLSSRSKTKITGQSSKLGDDGLPTTTETFTVEKSKDYTFKLTNPNMSLVVLNDKNQVVARAKSQAEAAQVSARLVPGEYRAMLTQNDADQFGADYEVDISEKASVPDVSDSSMTQIKGQTTSIGGVGNPYAARNFTVDTAKDYNFELISPQMAMTVYNEKGQVVASAASGSDSANVSAKLGPGTYRAILTQKYQDTLGKDYQLNISERASAVVMSTGGSLRGTAYPAASSSDSCVQRGSLKVVQDGSFSADLSIPNSSWTIQDKDGKVVAGGNTQEANQVTDFLKKTGYKLSAGDYSLVLVLPTTLTENTPWNFSLTGRVDGIDSISISNSDALPGSAAIAKTIADRTARLKRWAAESSSSSSTSA